MIAATIIGMVLLQAAFYFVLWWSATREERRSR